MSDVDDIKYVGTLLSAAHITMERVPESTVEGEKRCDLHGHDHTDDYLLEVKGIHEDEAMAVDLHNDGIYTANKPITDSTTVSDIIDDAVKQLRMTVASGLDGLRIAVLIIRGSLSNKVIHDRIFSTLYGLSTIAEVKVPMGSTHRCLYFSHSSFFKHRENLDAVVIMEGDRAGMCINGFSPRASRARVCRLGHLLAELNLLHDDARLEAAGFLVADCDLDRNDEGAVMRYLATKYKLTRPTLMHSYGLVGAVSLARR
jgi:hypothetical protein